jgi:hypothetical protein
MIAAALVAVAMLAGTVAEANAARLPQVSQVFDLTHYM